jgi:hypothetical protein
MDGPVQNLIVAAEPTAPPIVVMDADKDDHVEPFGPGIGQPGQSSNNSSRDVTVVPPSGPFHPLDHGGQLLQSSDYAALWTDTEQTWIDLIAFSDYGLSLLDVYEAIDLRGGIPHLTNTARARLISKYGSDHET